MPPDIAMIAGAGWKPFNELKLTPKWRKIVPMRTPELLWPLPGGGTVLSRYVGQLRAAGVGEIFAGVGPVGKSPRWVEVREKEKRGWALPNFGAPVWTQARVDYITSLGVTPVFDPGTHERGNECWHTYSVMLRKLLARDDWDTLMMLCGDYVLGTPWLHGQIGGGVYSSQVWMLPKHSIEFLDRAGAATIVSFWNSLSKLNQSTAWLQRDKLEQRGVAMYYIWNQPGRATPLELRRKWVDERRKHFREVGEAEYSIAWELAKGDPV